MDEKKKKVRRSSAELAKEIDDKITALQVKIKALEDKKADILNPKVRLSKAEKTKLILAKAKEAGLSLDDIADKLGLSVE
ncbi:MAG: hypothetical protein RR313_00155 [Anaerovoracaceae bacterium]